MVQVIWTVNKQGNTGLGGPLAGLLAAARFPRNGEPPCIVQKPASMAVLEKWCADNGLIPQDCELARDLGLNITCYSQRHRWEDEHKGKNNVIATFMRCKTRSGLAPNTVIGRALFVKRNAAGEAVDLTMEEFCKMGFFIDRLMDYYPVEDNFDEKLASWKEWYPTYDYNRE